MKEQSLGILIQPKLHFNLYFLCKLIRETYIHFHPIFICFITHIFLLFVSECHRYKNKDILPVDIPTNGLILKNVTPADTGTYMCVSKATNSQTVKKTICHISVFGKSMVKCVLIL